MGCRSQLTMNTMMKALAMSPITRRGPRHTRRRASIYIVTLGAAMVVLVIGLGALASVRVERDSIDVGTDFTHARANAHGAIELGYYLMRSDPNWRTTRANGVWISRMPFGDGTLSLRVTDPDDADLSAAPNNIVVMTGAGTCNDATFLLEVQLTVDKGGLVVVDGTWTQLVSTTTSGSLFSQLFP